jgi:crossover junction endodeoxyribonuclease RusA
MNSITISLPFPSRILSPNSPRRHWRAKQPAKETARSVAYYQSHIYDGQLAGEKWLQMRLTICPPNKRRRDIDNVFSAMKSALDGMCQGIGIDDSQIRRVVLEWGDVVEGGQVDVCLKKYNHSV